MTDARVTSRARPHLAWIVPLALVPFIFFAFVVLTGLVSSKGDALPEWVIPVPVIGAVVVPAIALVVAIINALRLFSSARRRNRADIQGAAPSAGPRESVPGMYEELVLNDASRRGLSPEEYGVYKGSVGSAFTPVNSAGGLLFISLLLTVIMTFVLVLIGVLIGQNAGLIDRNPDSGPLGPVQWFVVACTFLAPVASWHYYRVERRAQKLRISRGLPKTVRESYIGEVNRKKPVADTKGVTPSLEPETQRRRRRARQRTLTVLMFLIGPMMIGVGSIMMVAEDNLRETGTHSMGTIGVVNDGAEASTHTFRVDFVAEDESSHTAWGSWSVDEKPSVGDSVRVIYRSDNPDSAVLEGSMSDGASLAGFGGILTLISGVVGLIIVVSSRREKTRLKSESRPG
ncbi:MAG: hypothetical protein Q4P23_14460 [Micrococcaceae bacterium]|nr:hypothetical protein [Micrococcaceae bacterium]